MWMLKIRYSEISEKAVWFLSCLILQFIAHKIYFIITVGMLCFFEWLKSCAPFTKPFGPNMTENDVTLTSLVETIILHQLFFVWSQTQMQQLRIHKWLTTEWWTVQAMPNAHVDIPPWLELILVTKQQKETLFGQTIKIQESCPRERLELGIYLFIYLFRLVTTSTLHITRCIRYMQCIIIE